MKVIWDDLGRSIKLIVCAMGNYYLASIWIKEKAQIQSYSLKESIIVLIGMMFFIGLFGVAVTVELLRQIIICITKISTFLILCDLAVCLATLYVSFSLVFALMRYLQGKVFLIRFYSPTTLSSSRAEFRLPSRLACA